MKKILTFVAIATLTLGVGAIASAQDAGPSGGQLQSKGHHMGGPGGLKRIEEFQKDIFAGMNLTDDQKKQIAELNKSTEGQIKAFMKANKGNTDKTAMGEQRKDMMKKYQDSLKGILTPNEWTTYHDQMKAKMKALRDAKKDKSTPPAPA